MIMLKQSQSKCLATCIVPITTIYSIDATKTNGRLCQFANDSPKSAPDCNAVMKLNVFDTYPRLCLYSTSTIQAGEEIKYDYGENDRNLPWRKKVCFSTML